MQRAAVLAVVALLVSGLTACGSDPTPVVQPPVEPPVQPPAGPVVAGVRVRAGLTRVFPGQPVTVTAEPVDANGQPVPGAAVEWLWDHPQFTQGTIDGATLRLVSPTPRDVQITAVSAGHSATVTVRVRYPLEGAVLFTSVPRDTMVVGASAGIGVIAVDSLGRPYPGRPPTLTSVNPTVVRVEDVPAMASAHALAPGKATIIGSYGSEQATLTIHVKAARELFPGTNALYPGVERALQARALGGGASPLAVDRWLSSDPSVARVSAAGVVTAVAVGRATVSAVVERDTLPALVVVKPTPPPVEYVALARDAPCAIARDGGVWCWGSGAGGRLGTTEPVDWCESAGSGRSPCSPFPVRVQSDERFVAAAGTSSGAGVCALTAAGAVYCWGQVSNLTPLPVPTPIAPRLRAAAIERDCLLTTDGAIHCWGFMGFSDSEAAVATPRLVPSPVRFRQLSVGAGHRCGIGTDDVAYCWGYNHAGQLGSGSMTSGFEPTPKPVVGLSAPRQMQVDEGQGASTCALDAGGVVRCWGASPENGLSGRLGVYAPVPTLVPNVPSLAAFVGGTYEHCGLTAGGHLWCLGRWLGDGPQRLALPFALRTASTHVTIGTSCGIATDGALHCWGSGFLGDGRPPTFPSGPSDQIVRIARVAWQR